MEGFQADVWIPKGQGGLKTAWLATVLGVGSAETKRKSAKASVLVRYLVKASTAIACHRRESGIRNAHPLHFR